MPILNKTGSGNATSGSSTDTIIEPIDKYTNATTAVGGDVFEKVSNPTALSEGRHALAATSVGSYALFGGGSSGNGYSSTVDAYTSYTISTDYTYPYAIPEGVKYTIGSTTYTAPQGGVSANTVKVPKGSTLTIYKTPVSNVANS